MQVQMLRRGAVTVLLAALAVTGCTSRPAPVDGEGAGASGPTTTQGTSGAPTTTQGTLTEVGASATTGPGRGATATTARPTGEPVGTLQDGRHAVRILAVRTAARTVRFDVIQFLTGDAANKAAAEDGAEEIPVPNDYYIRNVNPRLRTLPVAPGAKVVVNILAFDENAGTRDTEITLAKLAGYPDDRVKQAVIWLTVSHGKIVRIQEQFIP